MLQPVEIIKKYTLLLSDSLHPRHREVSTEFKDRLCRKRKSANKEAHFFFFFYNKETLRDASPWWLEVEAERTLVQYTAFKLPYLVLESWTPLLSPPILLLACISR